MTPSRTVAAVSGRAICLYLCAEKAHGTSPELVTGLVDAYDVEQFLTGREVAFLLDEAALLAQQQRFADGIHACETLLWAIGRLDDLPAATVESDFGEVARPLLTSGSWQDVAAGAELRPGRELAPVLEAALAALPAPVARGRVDALRWLSDSDKRGWDAVTAEP